VTDTTLDGIDGIEVTYDGTSTLPVVIRFTDGSSGDFVYDTDADVLTPVAGPPIPTPSPTATPMPSPLLVFVTKGYFSASQISGVVGGDAKCAAEASNAGLPGVFRAWMSDAGVSAGERHTHGTVPYVLANGTQIADDWTDLTDGSIDAPITRNADGGEAVFGGAWTATNPAGTISYPSNTCTNWTSNGGLGADGYIGASNGDWSRNSVQPLDTCAATSRLYCFQQQGTPPAFCAANANFSCASQQSATCCASAPVCASYPGLDGFRCAACIPSGTIAVTDKRCADNPCCPGTGACSDQANGVDCIPPVG
jgi:hypothetical protein